MSEAVGTKSLVVGVVSSAGEFEAARRMPEPPDLFELRLDRLPVFDPRKTDTLPRPIIITARHPAEDGNRRTRALTAQTRRDLLAIWLPFAKFVDVELRSLGELSDIWDRAAKLKLNRICSFHDFTRTPSLAILQRKFQRALAMEADIFKIVTRAEQSDDFVRLLGFLSFHNKQKKLAILATGKFGPLSRTIFPQLGSRLIYAPLQHRLYPGQLTLAEWRRTYAANSGDERKH